MYQPPCGREAALGAPRDVVTLANASRRCGLFVASPSQPDAAALVPGSAVLYRVNGGRWALVARDCLPRRPIHLAISLFTDAAASQAHALAMLNPGPHFAFPPPSADELAEAVARGATGDDDHADDGAVPALVLPAPRALCELGLGAEEWMTQREAAAAPAEPEGEQCDDDNNDAARSSWEEEAEDAPPGAGVPMSAAVHDSAQASMGGADGGAAPETTQAPPPPVTGVALLLAAAAAAAAARLGLTIVPASDDAL